MTPLLWSACHRSSLLRTTVAVVWAPEILCVAMPAVEGDRAYITPRLLSREPELWRPANLWLHISIWTRRSVICCSSKACWIMQISAEDVVWLACCHPQQSGQGVFALSVYQRWSRVMKLWIQNMFLLAATFDVFVPVSEDDKTIDDESEWGGLASCLATSYIDDNRGICLTNWWIRVLLNYVCMCV